MTDGVLLRESLNEGDLDRYSVIILDEFYDLYSECLSQPVDNGSRLRWHINEWLVVKYVG